MLEFKNLEKNYPVETVICGEDQIWSFLRIFYFFSLRSKLAQNTELSFTKKKISKLIEMLKNLKNCFFFRKRDVFIFSNSSELKEINGKLENKLFIDLVDILEQEGVSYRYFETPAPKHHSSKRYRYQHFSSTLVFSFFAHIFASLLSLKKIKNQEVLRNLNKDFELDVPFESFVREYYAYRFVYNCYLRFSRPKVIYLSQYYSRVHMPLISAAKGLKIPVVEYQHGVINTNHPAYIFYNPAISDRSVVPTTLFSFGTRTSELIGGQGVYDSVQIIPVGSSYLDLVKKQNEANEPLKTSKLVVLVTLQLVNQKKISEFINMASTHLNGCKFLLLKRDSTEMNLRLNSNVEFVSGDFYELVRQCSVHVTAFSTCVMEAMVFNKPTILIDDAGMATLYYGEILKNLEGIYFAKNVSDFVSITKDLEANLLKGKIEFETEAIFRSNHRDAIKYKVKDLLRGK